MKAALNAHFLHHPTTGSGQYLLHLVNSLGRIAPDLECVLHCAGLPAMPDGGWPAGLTPAVATTAADRLGGDARKVWWEQVAWPRLAARSGATVGHVPYFAPPLVAPRGLPIIATIHDVIPLILPEYVTSPLVRFYNLLVGAGARRAALILVDSVASQQDVVRLLHVRAERVKVVYLGIHEGFTPHAPEAAVAAVREKYGLQDPFVFYLGGLDRRKNVSALLEAMARLPREMPWQLAISGRLIRHNPRLFPDLPALAERLGIADRVRFVFVTEADKALMYRAAACFAFPSLYEGFGLDPLEAMACGTPVVCSNRSSLPELMGDAATLVDPDNLDALSDAIHRVLQDADLRRDLSVRGPAQAARFRWDETARQTLAAYQEVACAS